MKGLKSAATLHTSDVVIHEVWLGGASHHKMCQKPISVLDSTVAGLRIQ